MQGQQENARRWINSILRSPSSFDFLSMCQSLAGDADSYKDFLSIALSMNEAEFQNFLKKFSVVTTSTSIEIMMKLSVLDSIVSKRRNFDEGVEMREFIAVRLECYRR